MGRYKKVLCIFLSFLIYACQTTKDFGNVNKHQYKNTRLALRKGDYQQAKMHYPDVNELYFIPTLEYGWISLLNGKVNTEKLVEMSQYLEDTKTVHIENEARRFFFKELDEFYLPAEHEIIMFHMISGLAFAKKGLPEQVCVEAKRAAYYLPGPFINKEDFDDPGIRMMLAALWLYCDNWQQARANLLKASKLSKKYTWAGELARKKIPPKNLAIILKGVGPEVVWKPEKEEAGRWGLVFITEEKGDPLKITDEHEAITAFAEPTKTWYIRHFERDTVPRTVLDEVKRTSKVVVGTAGAITVAAFALIGATIIVAGSIALSAGLIALAGESGSSDAIETAIKFSGHLVMASLYLAKDSTEAGTTTAGEIYDDHADESENYRFVRFLPSYIYSVSSNKDFKNPRLNSQNPLIDRKTNNSRVLIFFEP